MDFADALNIARQVKSRYQAFEKLEEVLLLVANLDAAIKEKQATLKSLTDGINAGYMDLHSLEDAIREAKAQHEELLTAQDREARERQEQHAADHAEHMASTQAEFEAALEDGHAKLTELNHQIAERQELAAGLDKAVSEKRDTLNALRVKLREALDD